MSTAGKLVFSLVAAALLALLTLPHREDVLRVFAAASTREAFQEIGRGYERAHPGIRVEFHFAGSQTLRVQIEQGARADVFASADMEHMRTLRRKGLVEPPAVFAHNRLVVVMPRDSARVRRLADLARPGVHLVLAGSRVPAGHYAEQALASLSASGRYGGEFRARALANVVSRESSVRAVLSKVLLGEADAGIVYVTDAETAGKRVRVLPVPAAANPRAAYPVAVVSDSRRKELAAAFIGFLKTAEGKQIMARHGFLP